MSNRNDFREQVCDRDDGECIVPWCDKTVTPDPDGPGEQHHIINRGLWPDGGYIPRNGVNVCNPHHQMAERNEIPPQAFWRWADIRHPKIPGTVFENESGETIEDSKVISCHAATCGKSIALNKWGDRFETPPHYLMRDYRKYPSTRHLLPLYWHSERGTAEERTGRDDTGLTSVESFMDIPLVTTIKMDGSNTMLVSDTEEPVRARNGREADHESFDHLKQEYWDRNVYENLPDHLQVFGENMYAKHSIHYGCDGCCDERNQGPPADDVFLVFGVYDTRYDLWLSWPETEEVADQIGFETVPPAGNNTLYEPGKHFGNVQDYYAGRYESDHDLKEYILDRAEQTVDQGHEGIIVRSMYPFHYDQFDRKIGKYVRPNHVQTDEHWSHQKVTRNVVEDRQS